MPNELPYQTYERITGKKWTGGGSKEVIDLLNQFGITAQPGSAEANLQLQKKLLNQSTQASDSQVNNQTTINQNQNLQEQTTVTQREPRDVVDILKPSETNLTKLSDILKEQENLILDEREKSRQDTLALLEARLAEIDNWLSQKQRSIEKQGEADIARASAIALRAGLAGSPFGETYVKNVEKSVEEEKNIAAQEAMAKKNAIRAEVNAALSNIENRYKESLLRIKQKRYEYLQEIQKNALEDFKTLAKAPQLTFAQIRANRDLMKALVDQTGYDENTLEFIWASQQKPNEIEGFNTKIEGNNVISSWYDKITGQVKVNIQKIEEELSPNQDYDVKIAGDSIVLIPKNGVKSKDDLVIVGLGKNTNSEDVIIRDVGDGRFAIFDKTTGKLLRTETIDNNTTTTLEQKVFNELKKFEDNGVNISEGRDDILRNILSRYAQSLKLNTINDLKKNYPVEYSIIVNSVDKYIQTNPRYQNQENKKGFFSRIIDFFTPKGEVIDLDERRMKATTTPENTGIDNRLNMFK